MMVLPAQAQRDWRVHARIAAVRDGVIEIHIPGQNYQLELQFERSATPADLRPGRALLGMIRTQAWRIELIWRGGRYVEPVFGRPRIIQGMIVHSGESMIIVDCGFPIQCDLPTAEDDESGLRSPTLHEGDLVKIDIERGAQFVAEPASVQGRGVWTLIDPVPMPRGHEVTDGFQGSTDERTPEPRSHDQGALLDTEEISGLAPPAGDTPLE